MSLSKNKLMKVITSVTFALNDLALYLDTHPEDREALESYGKYKTVRHQAIKEYTENFGPLTSTNAVNTGKWSWAITPWPWEGDEN